MTKQLSQNSMVLGLAKEIEQLRECLGHEYVSVDKDPDRNLVHLSVRLVRRLKATVDMIERNYASIEDQYALYGFYLEVGDHERARRAFLAGFSADHYESKDELIDEVGRLLRTCSAGISADELRCILSALAEK